MSGAGPGTALPRGVGDLADAVSARFRRLLRRVFPRRELREDDVLLASFPKSGNTWVRFLWANVVAVEELGGREVDFHDLEGELGSEYDTGSYGVADLECLPRLVKTHRPWDRRAFGGHRSVYLHRHPGDVMLSYFDYLRARPAAGAPETLGAFLRSEEHGVPAWCRHVRSWIDRATTVLSYEELTRDAAGALAGVLSDLGIAGIPDTTLREAARRSSFSRLRELEEERGRPREEEFEPGYRFMRRGRLGHWRERLAPADADYLRETVRSSGLEALLGGPDDDAAL